MSTPPSSPTRRNTQQKRKDEDDFEFPPLRKTARKTVLEQSSDITLGNQYLLLPNVVIKQVSCLQAPPVARNTTLTPPANPLPRQSNNTLPTPLCLKLHKTIENR
ncbi:hypothetical protein TNIN_274861 [Trichonephila inaurata madagascariensis]|uniref:Uncharacterized protein n=1 Tax=Trichonephila inaurata madagascariensis TaxID=2747483 RepID=A0A8X6XGZ6_9ARAC|nr:hypothetical protein TNIN_274861 [Trichonephila inaurata madagascariensis]